MNPYIRYLASTDDSDIGRLALDYLRAFLRLGLSVRVCSVSGGAFGMWEHYSPMLVTPVVGAFVNVVCCDPNRWVWTQRVPMPTRRTDGSLVFDGEAAEGCQELRTASVRNVLMTNTDIVTSGQLKSAERYDAIVCPTATVAAFWDMTTTGWYVGDVRDRLAVHLIPVPVSVDNLPQLQRALIV